MGISSYFYASAAAMTVIARTRGLFEVSYSSSPVDRERMRHDWRQRLEPPHAHAALHDHRHPRHPTRQHH